eukprot:PLAT9207.2.p1 GENE.PLAT9207.2~~PLAT9207.2.p1  ORF type:complete len:630 (-),score=364.62 PLAT9207.2:81-1970(-)
MGKVTRIDISPVKPRVHGSELRLSDVDSDEEGGSGVLVAPIGAGTRSQGGRGLTRPPSSDEGGGEGATAAVGDAGGGDGSSSSGSGGSKLHRDLMRKYAFYRYGILFSKHGMHSLDVVLEMAMLISFSRRISSEVYGPVFAGLAVTALLPYLIIYVTMVRRVARRLQRPKVVDLSDTPLPLWKRLLFFVAIVCCGPLLFLLADIFGFAALLVKPLPAWPAEVRDYRYLRQYLHAFMQALPSLALRLMVLLTPVIVYPTLPLLLSVLSVLVSASRNYVLASAVAAERMISMSTQFTYAMVGTQELDLIRAVRLGRAAHCVMQHMTLPAVDMAQLSRAVQRAPRLTQLRLVSNGLNDKLLRLLLDGVRSNKTLVDLALCHNALHDRGGIAVVEAIRAHPTLARLELRNCQLGDNAATAVAQLLWARTTSLLSGLSAVHLSASGSRLSAALTTELTTAAAGDDDDGTAAPRAKRALRHFVSSSPAIKPAARLARAASSSAGSFRVGGKAAAAVGLTHICLAGNHIGEDGCAALADALQQNRVLQCLDVTSNRMGDGAASQLAAMLRLNGTLVELLIGGNRITDAGARLFLRPLRHNRAIRRMRLTHNKLTEEGKAALREGLRYHPVAEQLEL